ncbi:hypothetical protein KY349_03865 [Candidatus Woesearchaeota archaeon]|nr:hypothetical protein [Candidatus Woesearchaeota archaeon]
MKVKEFLKWYLHVDWKDITNYIALIIAALLLWWGIKTMIASFSLAPVP